MSTQEIATALQRARLRDQSNDPRTLILTLGDEGEEMQAPMDVLIANLRDHALPGVSWSFQPRPTNRPQR